MNDNKKETSEPIEAVELPEVRATERAEWIEQRLCARYPVSVSVEGVEFRSKAHFTGRVSDLSMGGCYVDTMTALPVGASLKVRLVHENQAFETKARVVTSSDGMGMSLLFTGIEREQFDVLVAWIGEFSGEAPPCEPELPEIKAHQLADHGSNIAQSAALNELIVELMRTRVLSDLKGRALLQKLVGK
jgi:hypothetical protein